MEQMRARLASLGALLLLLAAPGGLQINSRNPIAFRSGSTQPRPATQWSDFDFPALGRSTIGHRSASARTARPIVSELSQMAYPGTIRQPFRHDSERSRESHFVAAIARVSSRWYFPQPH